MCLESVKQSSFYLQKNLLKKLNYGYYNYSLFCSCGFIGPSGICAAYLKGKKIYFHDSQKQHKRELLIRNALSKSNLSKTCQRLATTALCYHMFPSCAKEKTMKHRLCKEDCLQVKKKVCKNQVPDIFPVCSGLPKRKGQKGKHCDKLKDSFKSKLL